MDFAKLRPHQLEPWPSPKSEAWNLPSGAKVVTKSVDTKVLRVENTFSSDGSLDCNESSVGRIHNCLYFKINRVCSQSPGGAIILWFGLSSVLLVLRLIADGKIDSGRGQTTVSIQSWRLFSTKRSVILLHTGTCALLGRFETQRNKIKFKIHQVDQFHEFRGSEREPSLRNNS